MKFKKHFYKSLHNQRESVEIIPYVNQGAHIIQKTKATLNYLSGFNLVFKHQAWYLFIIGIHRCNEHTFIFTVH